MIDLIFLSNPNTLVSCGTLEPLANSDHYTVQVTISISSKKSSPNSARKQVWLYSQADLSLAKQLLKDLPVASSTDNIDLFWRKWSHSLRSIMRHCIPRKNVPIKSPTPWINREIRSDVAKRERLLEKLNAPILRTIFQDTGGYGTQLSLRFALQRRPFSRNLQTPPQELRSSGQLSDR